MRGFRLHEARRARDLRQDASEAERLLLRRLRGRALGGFKFVRQDPQAAQPLTLGPTAFTHLKSPGLHPSLRGSELGRVIKRGFAP